MKKEKVSKTVTFRVTDAEYRELQEAATNGNITVSRVVRKRACGKKGKKE
jgi:hypothetical protein